MKTFHGYKLELWKYFFIFAVDCGNSGIGDTGPLFFNFDVVIERKHIEDIAKEALKETKIFLVDVIVNRSNVIQVFIDHNDGICLDDCAGLHRGIEEQLDREQEDFELQVSSPGLGQPIRVFPQYLKALGQKLEITLQDGDIIKGTLLEARPIETDKEAELVVRQTGTKRKPAPEEPIVIQINRIKTARIEIDFKQV
ncbi:MAG: ribosome assembly cofactor RimP [Porphyromonadaceae bacterium]|nr:MAG: ribosome assembly cofactor RimP [Porphyromonadaceae bacterium]